jgi:hypothetical protein
MSPTYCNSRQNVFDAYTEQLQAGQKRPVTIKLNGLMWLVFLIISFIFPLLDLLRYYFSLP